MEVLDLFSGIGGMSLGLEAAGMKTVAFCESDPYCIQVLSMRWPSVPLFRDVRNLDGTSFKGIDLVCGGFPCQPYSHAGKRRGTADDRDLWPEMFRVIQESRPTWVLGENVANFVNMALERTVTDLEAEGYQVRTFSIPACAVSAPHQRERTWIVANSEQQGLEGHPWNGEGGKESRWHHPETYRPAGESCIPRTLANPNDKRELQSEGGESEEWEWTGYGGWWDTEPNVGRVAHGIPNRVDRLKCLGNAVVPQVVEEIGRAIMYARSN